VSNSTFGVVGRISACMLGGGSQERQSIPSTWEIPAVANDQITLEIVGDGLLTITEAQALCRLSRTELYVRMERGLAYCLLGRRRMIPRRALLQMMGEGLVLSTEGK
jgi:hypothetical protein